MRSRLLPTDEQPQNEGGRVETRLILESGEYLSRKEGRFSGLVYEVVPTFHRLVEVELLHPLPLSKDKRNEPLRLCIIYLPFLPERLFQHCFLIPNPD